MSSLIIDRIMRSWRSGRRQLGAGACQIIELNELQYLRDIAEEWWRLWRRCPAATPFQSPAWLIPWWETLNSGTLTVVAVRKRGELIGLFPLLAEERAQGRWEMSFIGRYHSDYLDILVDPAHSSDAIESFYRYLQTRREKGLVSRINLDELASWSSAVGVPPPESWTRAEIRKTPCPFLQLTPGSGELPATIPPTIVRRIAKANRRAAARHGSASVVAIQDTYDDFLSTLFDLHERRWRSRGMPGVLHESSVQKFHRTSSPGLVEAGLLRLHLLVFDGRPVGAQYTLIDRQRAYGYVMGFDPDFAGAGPMTILLSRVIIEVQMLGCREFDFGRGSERYKYEWGCTDRTNLDISWIPNAG